MYIACQTFGSVCWTLEAIIVQHTYLERMYSLKNKGSYGRRHLGQQLEFTSRLSQMLFARWVQIARHLQYFLSQYTSQLNRLSTLQKKESPLGAAITVTVDIAPWRSFECSKDCLFGKHFHQGPVKTFSGGKYLHDIIQGQSSFLYLPKGLVSGCQMTGSVIHIYKERLLIQ